VFFKVEIGSQDFVVYEGAGHEKYSLNDALNRSDLVLADKAILSRFVELH
jgi:hypothetical protein